MAGFFGFFDYTKPGPGVNKDEPQKAAPLRFLDIYTRKFWNLIKINMLYFALSIPSIILFLIVSVFVFPQITKETSLDIYMRMIIGALFFTIPVIAFGPAQAGFTYVLRNYAREEHSFIFSDFKEHALKNFKQGMIICTIDIVAFAIMMFDLKIYLTMKSSSPFLVIPTTLMMIVFVIFIMMHMYIYPIMVTFQLKVKEIYKNAFIFSVLKFFPNLGILLLCFVLVVASFYNIVIGVILFPLITLSTIGLLTNFYIYPKLQKYMMKEEEAREEIQ